MVASALDSIGRWLIVHRVSHYINERYACRKERIIFEPTHLIYFLPLHRCKRPLLAV